MLIKLEQWWERKVRWFLNLPTWGKILSFLGFALLAILVSTAIVVLFMFRSPRSSDTINPVAFHPGDKTDPMVVLLEGQEEVDAKVQKAIERARKEIGDVEIKQERLDAAAKEAHKAIDEAKSPSEIVKIIRRGVYTVIFLLLLPATCWAQEKPGDIFYPMPPGEEIEIDEELYMCFSFEEMQTIGHGYVEYEKLFRLRMDMNSLIENSRKALVLSEIGGMSQRSALATLTAQNQFYKGSLESVLERFEEENKKKEVEMWAWRVIAGLLAVTASLSFVF